ncbi:hypothetical protein SFUMM280S_09923 [Streptomyces fumanus]
MPTISSTPARPAGRPDCTLPNTTSRLPVRRPISSAQQQCMTVPRVRSLRRAKSVSAPVSSAGRSKKRCSGRTGGVSSPCGATRVPSVTFAIADRQARSAVGRSRSPSQVR